MAYSYTAIDQKGKTRSGVMHAADEKALRISLRENDLDLINCKIATENSVTGGLLSPKLKPKEVTILTRKLAILIGSGKEVAQALEATIKQVKTKKAKAMLVTIHSMVSEGGTLAQAFGAFPNTFSQAFCASIEAGEETAKLPETLARLADDRESQNILKNKVRLALSYPIFLFAFAIAVALALVELVLPTIAETYTTAGSGLPESTVIVMAIADFLKGYWDLLAISMLGLIVLAKLALKNESIRYTRDSILVKMPYFGSITCGFISMRYIELLDILIASGTPLVSAMQVAERGINNRFAVKKLSDARKTLPENGATISKALTNTGLFPQMVLDFIETGEQVDALSNMLNKSAEQQRQESSVLVELLVSYITPILILTIGLMILFIVMAIITPIINLTTLIQ